MSNGNGNLLHASVPLELDGQSLILRYRALAFIHYAENCGGDLLIDVRQVGAVMISGAVATGGAEAVAAVVAQGNEHATAIATAPPPRGAGLGAALKLLTGVLWSGLIDAQPMLKRDDVARMLDFRSLRTVLDAVMAAMKATMPEAELRPMKAQPKENPSALTVGRDSGVSSETQAALLPMSSGI